ncbi:hypothetical protein M3J09_007672 [Ascochyta lentis]
MASSTLSNVSALGSARYHDVSDIITPLHVDHIPPHVLRLSINVFSAALWGIRLYLQFPSRSLAQHGPETRKPNARLLSAGNPTSMPPCSEPITALLVPRPRNEQSGEPVQRCAELAKVE